MLTLFVSGLMFMARFGPMLTEFVETIGNVLLVFMFYFQLQNGLEKLITILILLITKFKTFHVPFVSLRCFSSKLRQCSFSACCKIFVNLFLYFVYLFSTCIVLHLMYFIQIVLLFTHICQNFSKP